jgi:hypothetical protein
MKALLTYLSISVLLSSFAQNVPNGGFEIWETEDFYAVDSWVSYGKPLRSSDTKHGKYRITLENFEHEYVPRSIYKTELVGETITAGSLNPGLTTINTSLLSKGLYFINTTNTNQQCQQKIIKQ